MAGIKKKARPLNNAKNAFIKWLKQNNAENISQFWGEPSDDWDYYCSVDGFIGDDLYVVCFMMWNGEVKIDYRDEENRHDNMSIAEFMQLIP